MCVCSTNEHKKAGWRKALCVWDIRGLWGLLEENMKIIKGATGCGVGVGWVNINLRGAGTKKKNGRRFVEQRRDVVRWVGALQYDAHRNIGLGVGWGLGWERICNLGHTQKGWWCYVCGEVRWGDQFDAQGGCGLTGPRPSTWLRDGWCTPRGCCWGATCVLQQKGVIVCPLLFRSIIHLSTCPIWCALWG